MKQIRPYRTLRNALISLDNGGRFFNFLTQANDDKISLAEVGKVAGVFNDSQKMVLYLEMSLCELGELEMKKIRASLSTALKNSYEAYLPKRYSPSEAIKNGSKSENAIITGIPHFVTSKSDFSGFILIPLMIGTVVSMIMVPIIEQYDIYELRDENSEETFIIAHAKRSRKFAPVKTRIGGIIKEFDVKESGKGDKRNYIDTVFYTVLSS